MSFPKIARSGGVEQRHSKMKPWIKDAYHAMRGRFVTAKCSLVMVMASITNVEIISSFDAVFDFIVSMVVNKKIIFFVFPLSDLRSVTLLT